MKSVPAHLGLRAVLRTFPERAWMPPQIGSHKGKYLANLWRLKGARDFETPTELVCAIRPVRGPYYWGDTRGGYLLQTTSNATLAGI